jgi:hypothetical protein
MEKIRLLELAAIMEGLNESMLKDLPIKASYWISKLAKKVEKEFREFEEARMKLIKKYAQTDANMQLITKDNRYQFGKNQEAFDTEFKELGNMEIELDVNKIPISLFGDSQVSPSVMYAIEQFIDDSK